MSEKNFMSYGDAETILTGYANGIKGKQAALTFTDNTSTTDPITANGNIPTMNTLKNALNRSTGIGSPDTNYSTSMMRGISAGTSDLTAGSSALTSGAIYLVYE